MHIARYIKANNEAHAAYPLTHRYGTVLNALIRASVPDIYQLIKRSENQKQKNSFASLKVAIFTMRKKQQENQ